MGPTRPFPRYFKFLFASIKNSSPLQKERHVKRGRFFCMSGTSRPNGCKSLERLVPQIFRAERVRGGFHNQERGQTSLGWCGLVSTRLVSWKTKLP